MDLSGNQILKPNENAVRVMVRTRLNAHECECAMETMTKAVCERERRDKAINETK